jgi:diguanylate cyclase (GGDEF)-like protein
LMLGGALLVGPGLAMARELTQHDLVTAFDALLMGLVSVLVLWRIVRATRQRQLAEAKLTRSALYDQVTGLPNRRLLLDRLQQAIARLARGGTGIALYFLDLDRFKEVNDGMGHAAGDLLLAAVGDRLSRSLRPVDTVARLGGDEFVILCESVGSHEDAARTATRIEEAFSRPFDVGGGEAFVTASIGISMASTSGITAEALLRDADAAMYRSKEEGRNRFEFFDAAMRSDAVSRLDTLNELHRAVERKEFRLQYQPLVHLETGAIIGSEALIRWQHPERGTVVPEEFIPLAEASGLIVPIGSWVMEEAIAQAQRWHRSGGPLADSGLGVNISAVQLREPDFIKRLDRLIGASGIDPGRLYMELTESMLIDDTEALLETVQAMRACGVHVALDDFGTGYSSLSYLSRFRVDSLKIDRSFVAGLGTDTEDTVIVETIIAMARTLEMVTIGEGIETEQQANLLRDMGCTFGQGNHFGRPMAPDVLESTVAGWTPFSRADSELALRRARRRTA